MTLNVLRLLTALSDAPAEGRYALELTWVVNVGSVYSVLARLARAGWVHAQVESGDPALLERPLRTYYTLTEAGRAALTQAQVELGVGSRNAPPGEGQRVVD